MYQAYQPDIMSIDVSIFRLAIPVGILKRYNIPYNILPVSYRYLLVFYWYLIGISRYLTGILLVSTGIFPGNTRTGYCNILPPTGKLPVGSVFQVILGQP
jgi:hypothetical protein